MPYTPLDRIKIGEDLNAFHSNIDEGIKELEALAWAINNRPDPEVPPSEEYLTLARMFYRLQAELNRQTLNKFVEVKNLMPDVAAMPDVIAVHGIMEAQIESTDL